MRSTRLAKQKPRNLLKGMVELDEAAREEAVLRDDVDAELTFRGAGHHARWAELEAEG